MTTDPARTIQEASRGDVTALDSLLARYVPALRSFLRMRVGPAILARESADDLVQSVCREVLQDLPKFEYRDEPGFKQWLYLTADRKIRDRARFNNRQRRSPAREVVEPTHAASLASLVSPSRIMMAREDVARLQEVVDQLPDEQRDALTRTRMLGMSVAEVAQELGKSEGAIRMLLHRALARIGRVMVEG